MRRMLAHRFAYALAFVRVCDLHALAEYAAACAPVTHALTIANMALPATEERSSNGLSVLQRRLLVMATINRLTRSQERRTPDSCADLYLEQVLAEVYDLRPELDGEAISQRRYAAAAASFSRCLHRLERRGLVRYIRGGHNRPAACLLTPEGERLCQAMVNKRKTVM